MISIIFIGVAITLLAFAVIMVKVYTAPKKARKSEKAEIMKQLLALSECENSISGTASPVQFQVPLSHRDIRPRNASRQAAVKTSQPIRSNK